MRARIAVIYYSATGNVHGLAQAVAEGAEHAGAEVRLRHVEELASELLISQNQHWGRHRSRVADAPIATLDDLEWADGIAFGTPTRFGNVAAQLKQFIDQAGRLWQEGNLADKVATSFTSSSSPPAATLTAPPSSATIASTAPTPPRSPSPATRENGSLTTPR
jgi:NAD(P)H dehydrogenase (quinone)